jgi:F-type H+-transporting ATPase subunit b
MGSGGPIAEIATTFGVDWAHLIAQTISFSVLCALLYALAYRPVLRMLDIRRQQIAKGKANAEEIAAELARTKAARDQVLQRANVEAAKIIEKAHLAAARLHQQERERAAAAALQILAKAQETATRDRVRILDELTREVGRLVVRTTAVVTRKVLTPNDQRQLLEEAAQELSAP